MRAFRESRLLACLLVLLLAPSLAAAPDAGADGAREEFLYAWQNIANLDLPVGDSPKLRRYVLYGWLQAERLRVELSRVPADRRDHGQEARIIAILKQEKNAPSARGLYRDLLAYFAKRSLWKEFKSVRSLWPGATLPTEEMHCHEFSAQLALQDIGGLREAVREQWMQSRSTPEACEPAYAWIDSPERLSDAQIEERSRFAGKHRLPLPAAHEALPESRKKALRYWRDVDANPEGALEDFLAKGSAAVPPEEQAEGMVLAFERLARRDSSRARRLFDALQRSPRLNVSQRNRLRRDHALGLAYDHQAEAVEHFARLPLEATSPLAHEWRLRSALWNRKWGRVTTWLQELPVDQSDEPRWMYWRGRTAERRGDKVQAQAHYEAAAKHREYYAFLAAERLGRVPDLRHQPLDEDWPTLDLLATTPALRRARELFACDLPDQAAAEFAFALNDLPASAKPQLIRLAANWGWHDRAVILQAQLGKWNDLWLRFPLPFKGEVEAAARDTGLPPDWLYAVLRTESLYNPRAVSRAGARGLLQLMPPTARAVAKRAGLPAPSTDDLFHPEVNVALGARYLREMNDKFSGALILTLAAYNAGPHRIPRWLPDKAVDGDIWVENIPYNETRDYVQRALSSLVMIGWRRTGDPAPILPLLPKISAKLAASS